MIRHDGPDHLGLWYKCAPRASNSPNHLGLCRLTLSDIEFAFKASTDRKAVYDYSSGGKSFSAALQLLGLNNQQLTRQVFDLFVQKQADTCRWCGWPSARLPFCCTSPLSL